MGSGFILILWRLTVGVSFIKNGGHLHKEERNENKPKPENQLFDSCEPLDTVLQNRTKAVSKQWLGHLEIRNIAFLGPTQISPVPTGAGDFY